MYNIIYETSRQSRFDAGYWMLGAGALGQPRGMVWGGRREEGSRWGTHVYLWQIHFDIWQNQYNIVKLKNKIKLKKKKENFEKLQRNQSCLIFATPWTIASQAPLSMEICRQEHWSGVSLPSPTCILHAHKKVSISFFFFLILFYF